MGERVVRYAPYAGADLVDVCSLCQEEALEYGWLKEGAPTTPLVPEERRRRSALDLRTIFGGRRPADDAPVASEPILRRLSDEELGMVDAADLFNGSQFRRTIGGVAKSLGEPRASIVTFSGVNPELVITIAWDISWYQYRVSPDSAQPITARRARARARRARRALQAVERARRGGRTPRARHRAASSVARLPTLRTR